MILASVTIQGLWAKAADSDSPVLYFLAVCCIALVLHLLLWLCSWEFGIGGKGAIGDIRTVIGKSLRPTLGFAIWTIALTLSAQNFAIAYEIDSIITIQSGDSVILLHTLIGMLRTAILFLIGAGFAARVLRSFSEMLHKWHDEKDNVDLDMTAIQALTSIGVVLIWVVGIVIMLQALGVNMSAVITIGGIGGAAFAFASKDVIANFFGGLLIMFNRPFRVGDTIKSGSKIAGTVTRVGLYATLLETEDGKSLYVPNSIFNNSEILKSLKSQL